MKVRMKLSISGLRDGASWPKAGGEIDLPKDEAQAMIAQGYAEPVKGGDAEKSEPQAAETSEPVVAETTEPQAAETSSAKPKRRAQKRA